MLRKKKSLLDQRSTRRPTTSTRRSRCSSRPWPRCATLSKDAAEGAKALARTPAPRPARCSPTARCWPATIADATREVAIPKAKTAAAAGVAGAASLAAAGQGPRGRQGRRGRVSRRRRAASCRRSLVFGSLAAVAGFVARPSCAASSRRQLAVVVHPARALHPRLPADHEHHRRRHRWRRGRGLGRRPPGPGSRTRLPGRHGRPDGRPGRRPDRGRRGRCHAR